jgi:two-component system, oxyanion-binding sensor
MQVLNRKTLIIGFIPLLDCATLVAALEKGFVADEGLQVALVRETSWANIRDRLVVGHFDAAHMLGPMTLASTLGIGHLKVPIIAPYSMGLGGNAITVTKDLWQRMKHFGAAPGGDPRQQATALAAVIHERAARNAPPLTFGVVYPFSCHNYELRYWLAVAGIDPDRDVRLVVVPPPLSVDALRQHQVDGYCVGEPWNSLAVAAGVGCIVTTTQAIWNNCPEKVLGCREEWAHQNPERLDALLRAMYRAAVWCEQPAHHEELASILAEPRYVGVAADVLQIGLSGHLRFEPNHDAVMPQSLGMLNFVSHHATFPWINHAAWFYSQMVRWGQVANNPALARAAYATYRPDIYRRALKPLRVQMPTSDTKREGGNDGFFDGRPFNAEALDDYIANSSFATPAMSGANAMAN